MQMGLRMLISTRGSGQTWASTGPTGEDHEVGRAKSCGHLTSTDHMLLGSGHRSLPPSIRASKHA